MLQINGNYRNNDGSRVRIAGRIKEYSPERPWLWSTSGNWYHEQTGQFIAFSPNAGHSAMPADNHRSISNHEQVD